MAKAVKTRVPIESPLDIYKEVVAEPESQIDAQNAHDYYDSRSIIPADNVDEDGTAWATVGENIRKGSKVAPTKENALNMLSALLGIDISVEEVTCTLVPSNPIGVDNSDFIGRNEIIEAKSKTIVGFFVLESNISYGNAAITMRSFAGRKNSITMQFIGVNALTGTIKLAVLLA